jgi:glycosyltransferase involved in cell wall biosynthesis
MTDLRPLLSVVSPAYNEAPNLPVFFDRLRAVMDRESISWEWIVVDDHSLDETFTVVSAQAAADKRVRAWRLARNAGSHSAIWCGLQQARGRAVVVMAADLEDPPEFIPELIARWQAGAQVVWAARRMRADEGRLSALLAGIYYFIMRRAVGIRDTPPKGADFFLIDERVANALRGFRESNSSLFALLTWMGFRQASVQYDKGTRLHGRSGWSLQRKVKLALDSIASFTYLPIRVISCSGFVVSTAGLLYAGVVVANAVAGRAPQGWSSLMVAVLVLGGFQMLMMGILGEYLWRALEETRQRPRYLIEASTEDGAPVVLR